MKKMINITSGLRALLFFGLIMTSFRMMAQPGCDIRIHNNFSNCAFDVTVYILENPSSCGQCPSSPQVYMSIPPTSNVTITCADLNAVFGCTMSLCDLRAQVTAGGTSAVAFWGNGPVTIAGIPGGCAVGASPNINVAGNDINLNP